MVVRSKTYETDRLYTAWNGEWSRFSNQTNSVIPMNHDTSKMVHIPEGAEKMEIRFTYDPWNTDDKRIASLFVTIDQTGDGNPDWTQTGELLTDARTSEIQVSSGDWGNYWSVNVEGRGIDWDIGDRFRETQFKEVRAEFTISLNMTMAGGVNVLDIDNPHAAYAKWKPWIPYDSGVAEGNMINVSEYVYDLGRITPLHQEEVKEEEPMNLTWLWILIIIAVIALGGYLAYTKYYRKRKPSS
jgi:hypothetical protein